MSDLNALLDRLTNMTQEEAANFSPRLPAGIHLAKLAPIEMGHAKTGAAQYTLSFQSEGGTARRALFLPSNVWAAQKTLSTLSGLAALAGLPPIAYSFGGERDSKNIKAVEVAVNEWLAANREKLVGVEVPIRIIEHKITEMSKDVVPVEQERVVHELSFLADEGEFLAVCTGIRPTKSPNKGTLGVTFAYATLKPYLAEQEDTVWLTESAWNRVILTAHAFDRELWGTWQEKARTTAWKSDEDYFLAAQGWFVNHADRFVGQKVKLVVERDTDPKTQLPRLDKAGYYVGKVAFNGVMPAGFYSTPEERAALLASIDTDQLELDLFGPEKEGTLAKVPATDGELVHAGHNK